MTRIWVDFNDVDDGRTVSTLVKFADDPAAVVPGARVIAYHDDSVSVWPAAVVSVDERGLVLLQLD